jgi:EmrB/QacA subfamily drug resistance transporter
MSEAHVEPKNLRLTLATLALGGVAFALLQSLVAPALPEIQRSLHTTESAVSWVLTAYLLSAAVATPIGGRLGDMFGKERMLLIVLSALAAGTLLAALATSIGVLVAARVIQGIGGAVFPLAFGIIRDEFPRERVAGSIGIISALLGIGGGLGVVLAGVIVDNLSYHWLFWFPMAGVVISALATYLFIPESPIKAPGRINWTGAILMSAGLAAVLLAISDGQSWGWTSAKTVGLLAAGLVLLVGWVRAETVAREPLVDMQMMRLKPVWTTNLVGALLGVGMYSSFILVPQLVQLPSSTGFGFGASVSESGLLVLPSAVLMLLGGAAAGPLEARFGSRPLLIAGTVSSFASFVLLALAHATRLEIVASQALLGLGIGLAFASMANLIVQNVSQHQTGVATGMNAVMRSLGGAIGGQIAAAILVNHVVRGAPTESGFTVAFLFCAAALLIAIVTATMIPTRAALAREPRAERVPA